MRDWRWFKFNHILCTYLLTGTINFEKSFVKISDSRIYRDGLKLQLKDISMYSLTKCFE